MSNIYLVLLVILLFLILCFGFSRENYTNYYRKNKDLEYLASRGNIKKKGKNTMYKNKLAPIAYNNDKSDKIKVPSGMSSTRVPDDLSDMNNYVIPKPNFDLIVNDNKLSGNDTEIGDKSFKKKKKLN